MADSDLSASINLAMQDARATCSAPAQRWQDPSFVMQISIEAGKLMQYRDEHDMWRKVGQAYLEDFCRRAEAIPGDNRPPEFQEVLGTAYKAIAAAEWAKRVYGSPWYQRPEERGSK